MNGKAPTILNTSCLLELSRIMAAKTLKNPYHSTYHGSPITGSPIIGNGKATTILNTSCLLELSRIMAAKTLKNPYHSTYHGSPITGSLHLSCKRDQDQTRNYIDRRVTPPRRVTSPTLGPPHPCKQALSVLKLMKNLFIPWKLMADFCTMSQ